MPKRCSAYGCSHESERPFKAGDPSKRISFHKFPKDPEFRRQWILATKRKDFSPSDYATLCSEHFTDVSFVPGLTVNNLFPNAIPTIFAELPDYYQPPAKKRRTSSAREKQILAAVFSEEAPKTSAIESTTITISTASEDVNETDHQETDETDLKDRQIAKLEKTVEQLQKKLKNSRRRCKTQSMRRLRLSRKVEKFSDLLTLLQHQRDVSSETLINLRNRFDGDSSLKLMSDLLQPGVRPQAYSDEVREFASSLFFRSPSAYHLWI